MTKEKDFITYKCKENDAVLQVHFDYPPDSIHKTQIGEIHLQDPVKGGWFVIGYQDLKDAIREAEQARGVPEPVKEKPIFIPQQLCPVCNGTSKIIADGFTSSVFQVCPKCNGERTIPMLKA